MAENRICKVKSGKRERISFKKMEEPVELPYLVEVQKDTYEKFLTEGIGNVLQEFSPVQDYSNKADFYFLDYYFDEPKYTEEECKIKKQTYSKPLKVKTRLVIHESGQVVEQDVFLADIPIMNESGNFVINGVKRVIMNQLVRAGGVYYNGQVDKTGKWLFNATVRPDRGAWMEIEQTAGDVLKVTVDKQSKMSLGILLKSLGLGSDEDLLKIFGNHPLIKNTLEKEPQKDMEDILLELAKKLRPGDVPSIEAASKYINELFFTQNRYDMAEVGRFKYDKKLALSTRIADQMVARDIISPDGEVLAKADEILTIQKAIEIQNSGVNEVWVRLKDGREHKVIGNNRVDIYEYTGLSYNDLGINPKLRVYYPEIASIIKENKTKEKRIKAIKENKENLVNVTLTLDDIIAIVSYILDLNEGIGCVDQEDHLGNKRVKPVGESMKNAFRIGVIALKKHIQERMQVQDFSDVTPSQIVSARQINNAIKDFTQLSPLSKNMDEVNPLSSLSDKRRLTMTGPGGINKDRAGTEVRDINYTQYGRICPIETPEGENIGIVLNLTNHARIDEFGFLITPYKVVDKETHRVTDKIVYLTADEEEGYVICQFNEPLNENKEFVNKRVIARKREDIAEYPSDQVDYVDVSGNQFVSSIAALVPFIENDNAKRSLMACNMQRQAVPLIKTEAPMVATGMEAKVALDSGVMVTAKNAGTVSYVSGDKIKITTNNGIDEYKLVKFEKSNKDTCINQKPIVKKGEKVKAGDVIADGFSTDQGEIALGKDVLVGFVNWEGYNYEDGILISERLVKDDVFTSIYITEVMCDASTTKLGDEEITRDIPNLSEEALKNLDENGIVRIGAEVESGDILVGKVTPKGETELTPEERLLRAIFGEKAREVRDTSLRVEHGQGGVVVDVKIFTRKNKDELENGINTRIKVFIAQRRKIKVGDKISGRHGNKGVISRVLPEADMPYMANGQPLDVVLNPLGVPSRMNVGQLLETHLGLVTKSLGWHVESPVFNGANESDIQTLLSENNLPSDGKLQLYDGRTGEPFENTSTVGYMYMLKLDHMVDSKVHARATGPYVLVTQQPIGGKAKFGGQRFGEMEVWALEAYGASHLLQEMLTVKSDDKVGRVKMFESIVQGTPMGDPGIPEGFKVLVKEMQGLALDVKVLTDDNREVDINEISDLESEANVAPRQEEELKDVEIYDNSDAAVMEEILKNDINADDLFDSSMLFDTDDDYNND